MLHRALLLAFAVLTIGLAFWAGAFIAQDPAYLGVELLGNGNVHHVEAGGPAARAGLQVGDLVMAVDGRSLPSLEPLYHGDLPGETVVLTARRGGTPLEIAITLGRVSQREFVFRLELLFIGLIFWIVGVAGWLLRSSQPAARQFFVFSQVAAAMLFGEVLDPYIPAMSVLTDHLRYLVAPLVLHFFAVFPTPLAASFRTPLLRAAYGGYALLSLVFVTAVWVPLNLYASSLWIAPRLFEVVVLVAALAVLLRPHPAASLDALRRRRLLFAGMLLGIIPVMVTLTSMVLQGGRPLVSYEWTVPALALVPSTYGYAVYKGELGQADFLLNRGIVYIVLTALLLGVYALVFFGLNAVFASEEGWGHLVAGALLIVVGSTLFVPLRTWLQHRVDRMFYGGWYDYRSFVESASADLSRSKDLAELTARLQTAAETMRFQAGTLLWARGDRFYPVGSFGYAREQLLRFRMPLASPIADVLRDEARPFSQGELRTLAGRGELRARAADAEMLEADDITYWIPLVSRGRLRSILVTGSRQGDEDLGREDRAILSTLSMQAAIACENIALVESLQERLAEVERVRDELAETQARLTEGREEERLHLARELHDGPVQDLYALVHELELDDSTDASFRTTLQRVAGTLREICVDLRPPLLVDFGLDVTIRSHAARFQEKHPELRVEVELVPHGQDLPERMQLALFRIGQEALNNVAQHADASTVLLRFEADAEQIVLEIADDGRGFTVPERWIELGRRGHLGLLGIAERVEAIGGSLDVESAPGAGTTVRVTAPLPDEQTSSSVFESRES